MFPNTVRLGLLDRLCKQIKRKRSLPVISIQKGKPFRTLGFDAKKCPKRYLFLIWTYPKSMTTFSDKVPQNTVSTIGSVKSYAQIYLQTPAE